MGNTPQNGNCMVTYFPSDKLFKKDEQTMLGTTRDVKSNS